MIGSLRTVRGVDYVVVTNWQVEDKKNMYVGTIGFLLLKSDLEKKCLGPKEPFVMYVIEWNGLYLSIHR